ncbi:Eukaryotic-type carbonic anhydrase [Nitzschia inconspicua]|uniref:Eukaryotic-type carbonic anhydrase n=1 Tax=Nitzschia inconspicua TaxID=303405 RepID=A0A9K3PCG4_9STRA|nr:Eukaryotic-type carbonic anhydrase [Nitzschia inconspicua]
MDNRTITSWIESYSKARPKIPSNYRLAPRFASGRTWRDIVLYHNFTTSNQDPLPGGSLENDPPSPIHPPNPPPLSNIFHRGPTASPTRSNSVTGSPSAIFPSPKKEDDVLPVATEPRQYVFPEDSGSPQLTPRGYFNYDTSQGESSVYGPGVPVMEFTKENGFSVHYANNGWANNLEFPPPPYYYWDEFGPEGFGPWKDTLTERQLRSNQCGNVGMQSPIDIRLTGVACVERHQIRTLPGDYRMVGAAIKKQILPSKLRLLYPRRPCADFVNNPVCAEPDPPHADFPSGWRGFADTIHVDFKFPSEHRIYGQTFEGEMQIYHLHPVRRRLPVISVMIQSASGSRTDEGHNEYLQQAIDAFQSEYDSNMADCDSSGNPTSHGNGSRRTLQSKWEETETHDMDILFNTTRNRIHHSHTDAHFWHEGIDFHDDQEFQRRRLAGIWHPYHKSLMPSYYFFGYDGSLTEPPCTEMISWFVMDTPMTRRKADPGVRQSTGLALHP